MQAGRLEIEIATGIARLQADMAQARGIVGNFARETERALAGVKSAFAALGVGVSAVGFAAFIKQTMDVGDQLLKLSQKTGVAIDQLSKLKYVGDLSGVSTEGLAKGIKELSKNLVEATDGTSRQAAMFKKLSVDISAGPEKALLQLADRFAGLADGEVKTTLATQLFGKAGMDLIPMLNQGSEGMRKAAQEAERLGLVWTAEAAKAAEQFNDNLTAIRKSSDGLAIDLVNQAAPAMVAITNAMKEAAIHGGVLKAVWVGLGGALAELLGIGAAGHVTSRIRDIEKEIFRLSDDVLPGLRKEFELAWAKGAPTKAWEIAIQNAETQIKALQLAIRAVGGEFEDQVSRMQRQGQRLPGSGAGILDDPEAVRRAVDERKKAWDELSRHWVKFIDDGIENERRLAEAGHKNAADRTRAEQEMIRITTAMWVAKIDGDIEAYEKGLLAMAALRKSNIQEQEIELLRQRDIWTELGNVAGDFFADLIFNGKSAFDNLKRWAKQLLAEMIKLFATRWILNMTAAGGGMTAMGAAGAALAGGTGDGSLASSGLSLLSTGSSLWGAGSAFMAGWGGANAAVATGAFAGATAGGSVGGGFMASMGSWAAGLSSTGWGVIIVAIIAIVAALLGGRGGGDKVEGSFVQRYGPDGRPLGTYRVSDEYGDAFLRGTQLNEQLRGPGEALGQTFINYVQRFGGTLPGEFGFGLGVSHDPRGDAPSRAFANAMVNGRNVFQFEGDFDDKEIPGAIAALTGRALIAALQASDLQDDLDAFFDSIGDVANLTAEDVERILAAARELYGVVQGLEQLDLTGLDVTALRAFALEGEAIGQTFQRVAGAWTQLVDSFTSEETRIARATDDLGVLWRMLSGAGFDLPQTREDWLAIMRSIDLSTASGRALWARMMDLAPAFDRVTAAAAATMQEFDGLMGRLVPGYTRGLSQSAFDSAWGDLSRHRWAQGMTPDAMVAFLSANRDFVRGLSQPVQNLINAFLTHYAALQQNTGAVQVNTAATLSGGSLSGRHPAEIEFENYYRTAGARRGVRDYLSGLFAGNSLSPLPLDQQLTTAWGNFASVLGRAQNWDMDAISSLPGVADIVLRLARQMYGSTSSYVAIFEAVTRGLGSVSNPGQSMASFQLDEQKVTNRHFVDVKALLIEIRDGVRENTAETAEASYESGDRVSRSVENAGLKTARR